MKVTANVRVRTLEDVMGGHDRAEIVCLLKGTVVRRLKRTPAGIEIDPGEGEPVTLPANAPVRYEAWFMDRGSLLIDIPGFGEGKLCTEEDRVTYPPDAETAKSLIGDRHF